MAINSELFSFNDSDDIRSFLKRFNESFAKQVEDYTAKVQISSIVSNLNQYNALSSLQKLSKFLKHPSPGVKAYAAAAITLAVEAIGLFLQNPSIDRTFKISLAEGLIKTVVNEIEPHINSFNSLQKEKINSVIKLANEVNNKSTTTESDEFKKQQQNQNNNVTDNNTNDTDKKRPLTLNAIVSELTCSIAKRVFENNSQNPDSLIKLLEFFKKYSSFFGNDKAVSAIDEMITVMGKCENQISHSSLTQLAQFLSHKDPLVRECATLCIVKVFQKAFEALKDPSMNKSTKVQLANDIKSVFEKHIKPHLHLFTEDDRQFLYKVVQVADMVLLDPDKTELFRENQNNLTTNHPELNKLLDRLTKDMNSSLVNLERIRERLISSGSDRFVSPSP